MRGGFEPVFELAVLAEHVDLDLAELEIGVEDVEVALALLNAGVLLVLGGHLGSGAGAGGLELDGEGVELVLGEFAVDVGELDAGLEFLRGVREFEASFDGLIAEEVGFVSGVGGVGDGLASFGLEDGADHGEVELYAEADAVGVVGLVVLLDVVECFEAAVLGDEVYLRAPELAGVAEGLFLLGAGVGVGGLDAGGLIVGWGSDVAGRPRGCWSGW